MDVKCERCGTEYEFDDAKVTEGGVTVKCTHCGHLFKVARRDAAALGGEPSGAASPAGEAAAATATPPPRAGQWMIRRAHGEILHFKDLSTLQKWIIERKVRRDDEISKTGQSWKPLGSIVELSSFFLVVDGTGPEGAPTLQRSGPPAGARGTPMPSTPPPPPRGRDDLLDTGEFRLEGPVPGETPAVRTPHRAPPLPPSATGPTPAPGWGARPAATPAPEPPLHLPPQHSGRTPVPLGRHDSSGGIEIGPPPPTPAARAGSTARGFVIGVVVTGALLFLAFFIFDQMSRGRPGVERTPAPATGAVTAAADPAPGDALVLKLERAAVDYARDTESGFERADTAYAEVLEALGDPPSDPALAVRAHLGRARVAVTRAEYRRLEGKDATVLLAEAEQSLAAARALAPTSADVDLGFADYLRVLGEPASAARYVAKLERTAPRRPELAFVRAALALEEPEHDPAEVAERLASLPPVAAELPRVRYLRAVALRRAGRLEDAASALVELLAENPDHGPGRRLLEALNGKPADGAAPPEKRPRRSTPAAASVAARPAPRAARPSPRPRAQPRPRAAPAPEPAAPSVENASYDELMMRGYRLLEAGRTREALPLFQEAARRKERSPEPWANIAWCYLDLGDHAKAMLYFERSLQRSPRYADALYGIAETHERAGRTREARDAYRHYLEIHPRGRKAAMVQRKLERLR